MIRTSPRRKTRLVPLLVRIKVYVVILTTALLLEDTIFHHYVEGTDPHHPPPAISAP